MSNTAVTIDWLTGTIDGIRSPAGLQRLARKLLGKSDDYFTTPFKPMFGYQHAVACDNGLILQSSDRKDMKTNLIASGSVLSELERNRTGAIIDLMNSLDSVSRIDLAVDAYDWMAYVLIRKINDAVEAGNYKSPSSKHMTVTSGKGMTLYIGSRTSERMLRIYDKGIEQGGGPLTDYLRFELELKGDTAKRAVKAISQYGLQSVTMGWITDFFWVDIEEYKQIMTSALNAPFEPSQRKVTDTRKWLMGTVAKSVYKIIKLERSYDVLTEFNQAVQDMLNPLSVQKPDKPLSDLADFPPEDFKPQSWGDLKR
jgi:Replication initiation factor